MQQEIYLLSIAHSLTHINIFLSNLLFNVCELLSMPLQPVKNTHQNLDWFKWGLILEKQTYLLEDKNDTSSRGSEDGLVARKFVVLIEKFFIPCVCKLFVGREQQIAVIEAEESVQWMNSSDVKLSLFWLRSMHNPAICRNVYYIRHLIEPAHGKNISVWSL